MPPSKVDAEKGVSGGENHNRNIARKLRYLNFFVFQLLLSVSLVIDVNRTTGHPRGNKTTVMICRKYLEIIEYL